MERVFRRFPWVCSSRCPTTLCSNAPRLDSTNDEIYAQQPSSTSNRDTSIVVLLACQGSKLCGIKISSLSVLLTVWSCRYEQEIASLPPMHILITNDDGPPSPQSSPYVHCLVKHLKDAGHVVSVCLPHTQRSWIGKAHMIGQTLKPYYYRPSPNIHGEDSEGSTHHRPSTKEDVEEWILVDGTPASCVQIGLHHFFQDKGPIDLVVSGPNYGRNTTAVFALSSGTLGAALEAAVCRQRSIALSFAFFTRNHDPVIIEAACRHSVKVIEALWKQWPTDGSADLYSVNVPLVEGVEKNKTLWTEMLQNYWKQGSCFQEIDGSAEDEAREEEKIREGPGGEVDGQERPQGDTRGHKHKHFKWAPRFTDVYQSVEEAAPGNDGWAVKEGHTR